MSRGKRGFGLRAVIVESLGAIALVYLIFPSAVRPVASAPVAAEPQASGVSAVAASEPDSTWSRRLTPASIRPLPMLHLAAQPTDAVTSAAVTSNLEPEMPADSARSAFVARELEYSRRTLVVMLEQHLQRLVEPFEGVE